MEIVALIGIALILTLLHLKNLKTVIQYSNFAADHMVTMFVSSDYFEYPTIFFESEIRFVIPLKYYYSVASTGKKNTARRLNYNTFFK